MVVYGSAGALAGFRASTSTRLCRQGEATTKLLANSPAELARRFASARQAPAPSEQQWEPAPPCPPVVACSAPPRTAPAACPLIARESPSPAVVDATASPVAKDNSDTIAAVPASREVLTREELAALLTDDET